MSRLELCPWSDCAGCEPHLPAADESAARRWATTALADGAQVHRLRAQAAGLPGLVLANTTDHQLAEALVHAIVQGRLRVCGGRRRPLMRLAAQVAPPPAAPAASSSAPRRAPPPPPPPAAPPAVDAAATAQALRAASENGVPFCEECARAAAARAAA